jgi:hypothetical protein
MPSSHQIARGFAAALWLMLGAVVSGAPAYPLKASANGRYLVDQSNAPVMIVGDSPQALMVNLSTNEAAFFFANRAAYGFNTLWINLLCATYTGGRPDASTIDRIQPFTGNVPSKSSYDLTKTNEAYFARVDQMLELAAQSGIQVLLDPCETGSFLSVMRDNGTNRCRSYGRFLGERYKNVPNIVWMSGNDFQTWRTPADDELVRAVAVGIRDRDTNHLHTAELDYLLSSSLDDTNWNGIFGLNATYTYFPTYARLRQDFGRTNFLPTFMVEANYEFESLQGPVTTPPILRKQEYWTMTSGACGQMYGNGYTWPFKADWQSHLDTAGAAQVKIMQQFFNARAWFDLVPDTNHTVVVSNYGVYSESSHVADNDFLTAARARDGSLVVVYTPVVRQFVVDLGQLRGAAVTRWFDPSSAVFLNISGSPFTNSGLRSFTPPGNNQDGDGGWVLVLETNPPPDAPRQPPPVQPKFIQQSYATPQASQSRASVAYPGPEASGNANIVAVGWNDMTASIANVSDSLGNTYEVVVPTFRGNGLSQAVYVADNIRGGTNTVTVVFDQPAAYVDLRATEYAGLMPTNAFDGGTSDTGVNSSAESGPVALSQTNELVFGAGMTATTFTGSGPGFGTRVITSPDGDIVEDKIATTVGPFNATASVTAGAWLMQMAGFRAALPVAPAMRIFYTSTNTLVTAWPAASAGFRLQQNANLNPTNWSDVTNAATLRGNELEIILSPATSPRFYRLKYP